MSPLDAALPLAELCHYLASAEYLLALSEALSAHALRCPPYLNLYVVTFGKVLFDKDTRVAKELLRSAFDRRKGAGNIIDT